ncbi:MAG: DNA sulfur modification protein DndD [Candidatus Poribacteria bacterium]|nr:DNA sulfur modification protein DndD [Candidatus Poribacteria bacterium]
MILHKLTLNNVGLFRGIQTIHLTPKDRKPIILIGGMNGAGKTTLLDAVRLCLYGKRSLGSRVSHNEYYNYLFEIIHRSPTANSPIDRASVSLEFEYARDGEKKRYTVERSWKRQRGREIVKEDLAIYENDRLNTEFGKEHWQDYINELISIGVSQFFFFDGENVRRLVDDSGHDVFLRESIKALFGLTLVERLQSDLHIYSNRLVKRDSPESVQQEISEVESEIKTLQSSLADAEVESEDNTTQIDELEDRIEQQEHQLATEGGNYARQRGNLSHQQEQHQVEIEDLENKIRYQCGELFPFALVPENLERLKVQLLKELQLDEWKAKNRALKAHKDLLLEHLPSEEFWADISLKPTQILQIQNKVASLLTEQLEYPEELRDFQKIRERSPAEYDYILEWIDDCLSKAPQEFKELNEVLEIARSKLKKVENALQKVPPEDMLKPIIENLSELNKTLGQLQKEKQNIDEMICLLTDQIEKAKHKRDMLYHTQQQRQAHIQRPKRVENVQTVLAEYTAQLTQAKMVTLSNTIVEGFNLLSHKPDRIKRVEIDPHAFAVTLYDTDNRSISKDELSAGEQQIYTTALLWGLAKTSGKPLPMILDTPLGRLDSSHRQLLVESYFPYASHQIVLLSTDTEIAGSLLSLLTPHISHTFHLAYQQAEGHTTIEEGYFG